MTDWISDLTKREYFRTKEKNEKASESTQTTETEQSPIVIENEDEDR